jgi:hypothetical protein
MSITPVYLLIKTVDFSCYVQSKKFSLVSKLQAPDKEATARFTVDMSESLHRELSMLASKRGARK